MEPLYVAKPLMPSLTDLHDLLKEVWDSGIVTNGGPLHCRLEDELAKFLGVPVAKLFCNGTVALQCALLCLELPAGSEVITTPLTFAATAHVITACGLKPVFADIDPVTLTLDPIAVECAITENTRAVIAVHVYGTICDDAGLQSICNKHGLDLIYDGAHAFASNLCNKPVAAMGSMTMFSLHATKLFNTFEGGLITSNNSNDALRLQLSRNFGIADEETVRTVGLNGKMSELNAAVGLLNLKSFERERELRSNLRFAYDKILDSLPGLTKQIRQVEVKQSEQYYALLVDPSIYGSSRDEIYNRLKAKQIFARRYFWPICSDFDCYRGMKIHTVHDKPVVEQLKDRVLCLPFHSGVSSCHIAAIEATLRNLAQNG